MIRHRRLDAALLLLVFVVSLGVRVAFARGFDGLYGQDAYAYYNYAGELRHAFSDQHPLEPSFYPLGYAALLATSFTLFGITPLAAQAVNLLLGALLAPCVYLLTRQLGSNRTSALAAGLILAFCGQAIQSSIVVMADVPALFWATFSAVLLLRYLHTARRRWLLLAALLLAFACITRWLYLALIPVWVAALLLTWRHFCWRELFAAGGVAALILLPQAVISLDSPDSALDHHFVAGWSLDNVFQQNFSNTEGQFDYVQSNAFFYAQPTFVPYYLAPLFTPFTLFGLWFIRRRYAQLALLSGWLLLPYLFLVGIPYQNIRYPLIVVPAVAILTAIGLEAFFNKISKVVEDLRRTESAFFLALGAPAACAGEGLGMRLLSHLTLSLILISGLFWMLSADQPIVQQFVANQNHDKSAVQWVLEQIPPASRVYCYGLTEALVTYAPFEVRELYNETPQTIATQLADGTTSYFFSNIWVIENQWAGRPLQATFHWLRDTPGLTYLDRIGNYILFRVGDENRTPASGLQQSVG